MYFQNLYRGYVPLPDGATAVYEPSGLAFYRRADWLGSARLETTPSSGVYLDTAYAPYGESYATTGNHYDQAFTGISEDIASPFYDFLFRDYSSVAGRWFSPDPAGMAATDPTNPQSWNRYAYVLNSPMNNVDPLGLYTYCYSDASGYHCINITYDLMDPDLFDPAFTGSPSGCQPMVNPQGMWLGSPCYPSIVVTGNSPNSGFGPQNSGSGNNGSPKPPIPPDDKNRYAKCFQSCVNQMFSSNSKTFVQKTKSAPKTSAEVGIGGCGAVTVSEPYLAPSFPACAALVTTSTAVTLEGLNLTEFLINQPTSVLGCAYFCK